jgi:F0F1-type ATP synthase membrane subunit c/vacuolar-type H+-ATPase subunit K
MDKQEPAEVNISILKIIWGALFISQMIYSFLAYSMYGEPLFIMKGESSSTSIIFSIAALTCVLMAFTLFRLLIRPVKKAVSFADAKQKYFVPFVIRLVLIEACSIFGFAFSSMVEQNLMTGFTLVALISFLFCFPTESKIKKLMR